MMNGSQQLHRLSSAHQSPSSLIPHKPFIPCSHGRSRRTIDFHGKQQKYCLSIRANSVADVKGVETSKENASKVKAVVRTTSPGLLSNLGFTKPFDVFHDLVGKTLLLELVSADIDSGTGSEKGRIKGYAHKARTEKEEVIYESEFIIPAGFGDVGAILVENEHRKEMFLNNLVLDGLPNGPIHFNCSSWVHSKFDNPKKRIFFSNKSYLPNDTPTGLKKLREMELENMRGDGGGERKKFDRIYDYDTYNDLGDPDSPEDLARPALGSKARPYPRRCRTGRSRCKKDPMSEKRSSSVYVPRDETFEEVKQLTFSTKALKSVLHALLPQLEVVLLNPHLGFPHFTAIDALFQEGVPVPKDKNFFQLLLPRLVKTITDGGDGVLLFEAPEMIERDKFSWFRDEEFSRQTLAGLNPYSLQLVTEWPLKSKLDPAIYGPPESLITAELVEREIRGVMTADEVLKQKKMFILDYHDLLLPFVNKVREIEGTTLYGSRTLFFLTAEGTLQPIAIELTRPPVGDKPQWKQVFTPGMDSTSCWLWRLAKAHVCAHDSGYHQLVIHWYNALRLGCLHVNEALLNQLKPLGLGAIYCRLRTHCCTEPYIIAANRQLSAMHPIYRLLHPHFRYTMEINALARQSLINAGGIIESCFSPGKYSIELSSAAYDQLWRFDMEALPADLTRRGMAFEDPTAEHGLKLTIEDYPFANDGLILWDAIKQWVRDYVNHYYPDPSLVGSDKELQDWWTEVRTKGHADKKDEPWWPVLKTPEDLVNVLTTIIWVVAGHHAAVNFGQYVYGGYFPNRPTAARANMPTEDPVDEEFKNFLRKPEFAMLKCFPSQIQATRVMAVLDVLSTHSPDEEYLGDQMEPSWAENPVIKAAFERFSGRLKELEGIIDERNTNLNLKNRTGAGVVPYELLKPLSKPGVTGMGVPTSISI